MNSEALTEENRTYWTGRASGYSKVVEQELLSRQKEKWKAVLQREMEGHFAGQKKRPLKALDAGTGPGFFAVLLSELGCEVTAIDLTAEMLEKARENSRDCGGWIRFLEMNTEDLSFEDECFDLVVSRNLTWNLPHPEAACREWNRVLKPGGLLLNFDANWYRYLFDEKARKAYEKDREVSAEKGIADLNVGENFDVMEDIACRIPLSGIERPMWDLAVLSSLGMCAEADPHVYKRVWSEEEKINFLSTPMFMVRAVKPAV